MVLSSTGSPSFSSHRLTVLSLGKGRWEDYPEVLLFCLAKMKHTLSVLVEDESGALSRISGLFARRGFNIESLAVGPAEQKGISRLTMVVEGDDHTLEQMRKQLNKLVNVLGVINQIGRAHV